MAKTQHSVWRDTCRALRRKKASFLSPIIWLIWAVRTSARALKLVHTQYERQPLPLAKALISLQRQLEEG